MPRSHRVVVTLLLTGGAALGTVGSGCGTNAVGIEDCRAIEQARCAAAAGCPAPVRIDDVDACQRYYRDHCLHGLPLDEAPARSVVDGCVDAIEAAGACASRDPTLTIDACDEPALALAPTVGSSPLVCDLIDQPEQLAACAFLEPKTKTDAAPGTGTAAGMAPTESAAGTTGGGAGP